MSSSVQPLLSVVGAGATEPVTLTRFTHSIPVHFDRVLGVFRSLVPRLDLATYRAQNSVHGIETVIEGTGTPTGFVLFAEFDHGAWMRHFPSETDPGPPIEAVDDVLATLHVKHGRKVCRFVFGNPLFAHPILRLDIEAALHIPLDCCFIEELDGSTRMIMELPSIIVCLDDDVRPSDPALKLQEALAALIRRLTDPDVE